MRESMTALLHLQEMREFFRTQSGQGMCLAVAETECLDAMDVLEGISLDMQDERWTPMEARLSEGNVLEVMEKVCALPFHVLAFDPQDLSTVAKAKALWERGNRFNIDMVATGKATHRWLVDSLDRAAPWWTHPDMVRLANAAAADIGDDHVVHASDLPMEWGYVQLGTPVQIGNRRQRIDSILWAQSAGGVTLIGGSARHGADDPIGTSIAHAIPAKHLPPMIPAQLVRINFGEPVQDSAVARFMTAWWHLVAQPITNTARATASKVEAKRDKRLRKTDGITEVRLRPMKIHRLENQEERSVDWQQRWLVRGHWRNQPYKDGRIEKIYIHPYIKGPADKPLVVTQKLYRWDR